MRRPARSRSPVSSDSHILSSHNFMLRLWLALSFSALNAAAADLVISADILPLAADAKTTGPIHVRNTSAGPIDIDLRAGNWHNDMVGTLPPPVAVTFSDQPNGKYDAAFQKKGIPKDADLEVWVQVAGTTAPGSTTIDLLNHGV